MGGRASENGGSQKIGERGANTSHTGSTDPVNAESGTTHLEFTEEEREEIMVQYFREPENLKDLARRWWRLVKERSLSAQDLAEELDRLRKETGNDKEWRTTLDERREGISRNRVCWIPELNGR
jgi:hypothetical protein